METHLQYGTAERRADTNGKHEDRRRNTYNQIRRQPFSLQNQPLQTLSIISTSWSTTTIQAYKHFKSHTQ